MTFQKQSTVVDCFLFISKQTKTMETEQLEGASFHILHVKDGSTISSFFQRGKLVKVGGDSLLPILGDFCLLAPSLQEAIQEVCYAG